MKIRKFLFSAALILALPLTANATVFNLAATLTPGAEVPPVMVPSSGFGSAAMVLNDQTGMFAWVISFGGLTGPATAAHFHFSPDGSAGMGGVVFNLETGDGVQFHGIGETADFFSGSTTLPGSSTDPDAIQNILEGNWYINIHTAANPGGEIRGQVLGGTFNPIPIPGAANPIPIPGAAWLFLSGLAGLLIVKRTKTA